MTMLSHTLRMVFAAMLCLALSLVSLACYGVGFGSVAFASDVTVTGIDTTEDLSDGDVAVADVQSSSATTLFVKVTKSGDVVGNRLAVKVDAASVATLAIKAEGLSEDTVGQYGFAVYADPTCKDKVCSGKLAAVYADYTHNGKDVEQFVGVRSTIDDESLTARPYTSTSKVEYKNHGVFFVNAGTLSASEGDLHVAFVAESSSDEETVTGTITYVDATGATITTKDVAGLGEEPTTVTIPDFVLGSDGATYRTVCYGGSVTLSALDPGKTIRCVKVTQAGESDAEGTYVATINFVDESGTILTTDRVTVSKAYTYVAPTSFYQRVATSEGSEVVTYHVVDVDSCIIKLAPGDEGVVDGKKTITVTYEQADAAEQTWTVVLVDGRDGRTILDTKTFTVTADDPTVMYNADPLEIDGQMFVAVGNPQRSYTYGSGAELVEYVYYVPEDYEAGEAYDVTVRYVDFASNETLQTTTITIEPNTNEDVIIPACPETFDHEGVTYVRLAGQDSAISHGYYNGNRDYVVYYRDENDHASENVVITKTVIVQSEVTKYVAADGSTTTGLTGRNVTVGDDTNRETRTNAGTTTDEERVNDNPTPLAPAGGDQPDDQSGLPLVPVMVGGLAILAILGAALLMFLKRRKGDER